MAVDLRALNVRVVGSKPWITGWRVRRTDYESLTSAEARELMRQEGIIVTDYRQLQQAWSQTNSPR